MTQLDLLPAASEARRMVEGWDDDFAALARDAVCIPDTLANERQRILDHLDEGTDCRACGQLAKRYRRRLNTSMVRFLIGLVKAGGWVHYLDVPHRGQDYAYLYFFGLAESKGSGYWRATDLGRRFLRAVVTAPEAVFMHNNRLESISVCSVTAQEALGRRFDLRELMGAGND